MPKKALIAGCGYVGCELAARLVRDGHDVYGLRRNVGALPAGVRPVEADLADASTLDDLPRGLDVIFYTASSDASSEQAYRRAYVDGLRNAIEALSTAGSLPGRLIVTTSTAVYGQDRGEWVDETSETAPEGFQGRVLLESERLATSTEMESVVVRFGGIYGPGRTRLIDSVRRGEAAVPDRPAYTNRIHRDDCAGVLRHLMGLPAPERVYLGVDDEPADRRDLITWLAAELGAPEPPLETRSGPSGKRCRNARLVATGYAFEYPTFRQGYAAVLADLPSSP